MARVAVVAVVDVGQFGIGGRTMAGTAIGADHGRWRWGRLGMARRPVLVTGRTTFPRDREVAVLAVLVGRSAPLTGMVTRGRGLVTGVAGIALMAGRAALAVHGCGDAVAAFTPEVGVVGGGLGLVTGVAALFSMAERTLVLTFLIAILGLLTVETRPILLVGFWLHILADGLVAGGTIIRRHARLVDLGVTGDTGLHVDPHFLGDGSAVLDADVAIRAGDLLVDRVVLVRENNFRRDGGGIGRLEDVLIKQ